MTLTPEQREGRKALVAAEFINRGGCCASCQAQNELEWHHLNPSKKRERISALVSTGTVKQLREELAKCDLLCRRCHVRLHRAYNKGMRPLVLRERMVAWLVKDRSRRLTHA